MIKNKLKAMIFAITISGVMASTSVLAYGPDNQRPAPVEKEEKIHKNNGLEAMERINSLNLSDEQKDQIRLIVISQIKKSIEGRVAQHKAADHLKERLEQLLEAEVFDEALAKELIMQESVFNVEQRVDKMAAMHKINQVLTPEQRQQLKEMGKL